ncbi:MAG TPA: hypothetical protein VIA06_11260 [Candidatus Dormibacteraeota bacterium]|nr:hypothetical protein [Candidatus Dormibacteraeota bacterium]
MTALLHDSHAINIATVLLVTMAGLYGYQGLLGSPGGVLRQLLVGIPLGIVFGLGNYLFDVGTGHLLSRTLETLIHSAVPVTAITIEVISFFGGVAFPMIAPNVFRIETDRKSLSTPAIVAWFLVNTASATMWNSIGIEALFQLLRGWVHVDPPLAAVIAAAAVLGALGFAGVTQTNLVRPTQEGSNPPALSSRSCLVIALSMVALVPQLVLMLYFVLHFGWVSVIYFLAICVAAVVVVLVQYVADRLRKGHLQVVSLVVFLIAAALQVYQAAGL